MTEFSEQEMLREESLRQFELLVDSVGVKRFSQAIGVGTRQVNRILSGAQPNPIERLILALQGAKIDVGDRALDYVCQEMGGHFVRHEALDDAAVNAVKECAEAIAAISDGQISDLDVKEIREAISALSGLIMSLRESRENRGDKPAE